MTKPENYSKILNFLEEVDSLKSVGRKGYLKDHSRHDNPAEHTWHMMLSMVLFTLSNNDRNINLEHALCLALVHDIVEVYSGDTPRYDEKAREQQKEIEANSAVKIFGLLPKEIGNQLLQWWKEFEDNKTVEAQFANHCDYLQGFSQSYFARGKSWKENNITKEITEKYTGPIAAENQDLAEYIKVLYEAIDRENLLK